MVTEKRGGRLHEFVPNGQAIWQSETAKTFRCPFCLNPVFTQYEGDDGRIEVKCKPEGHHVTWPYVANPLEAECQP